MNTPTTIYRVDSLYINVGVGDSAIQLLVDPQAMIAGKPIVKRACLIDGGQRVNGRDQDSHHTIRNLKSNYHLSSDHEPGESPAIIRFDSVVITHWDGDHFGGIAELLQWDFMQQWENNKLSDHNVNDEEEFDRQFKHTMKDRRCRYFRYGPQQTIFVCAVLGWLC